MRLIVQLELPDTIALEHRLEGAGRDPSRFEIPDSEVRDPAVGAIGRTVGPARINWRDGRRYLEITVEVDDQAAVDAATRRGPIF